MAQADGTILIDTEIKKDGAIDDIASLKQVVRDLTAVLKDMTATLTNAFNGTSQANAVSKQFDDISKSAKEAESDVKSLEEQMNKITVDRGEQNTNETDDGQKFSHERGEFQDYGNSVQEFVDNYVSGMGAAGEATNEFKREIASLSNQLKDMESQGLYFGDDEYDELYLKLEKIKQALVDYKKELTSPTESPKLDDNTMEGQIDALKRKLRQLSDQGKTFGDDVYDSTYKALKKAESELNNYKKDLTKPTSIPVTLDPSSFEYKKQQLKAQLDDMEKRGITLGDPDYDRTYAALQNVIQAEKDYKKALTDTDDGQKKAKDSSEKMTKSLDKTSKSAKNTTKNMSMLGMLGKSIAFSLVFKAIGLISSSVTAGYENLARYSKSFNSALSSLMSSMTMLKNSFAVAFAPVIEFVTPALSKLITKLAEVNNWIAQTMAALAGKDTFVKAIAVQEDYAASLAATQKALKEMKRTFGFDTLIQLQKVEYRGPTPDQMFKTEQVSAEAKLLADNVKKTLSDLFRPIKASWDQYGPSTIAAVQTMFGSLGRLAADIGASFMQVWKDEGYGKAITDDLLITFSNFALTIANLADQFDKAWTEADTGTSIMRHLGDLVLVVTGFFREASEAIKNWAASLDFGPLLRAFDGLLVSLIPIVQKIGAVLLWLLNNILLPIAKWAIEQAIPAALELIAAGFTVLNAVLDALKPLAIWLWEEFLKPFGEWAGEVVIDALKKVTEKLTDFSNWIKDNQGKVQLITELVINFFLAWKVAEFVTKISQMIAILSEKGLMSVLINLLPKLNMATLGFFGTAAAVGALAIAASEIYKNWDKMTPAERTITMILALAAAAATLAVALGAVGGAAGAVLQGAAIAAGIGAALIAINAGSRQAATGSGGGGGSRGSFAATNSYAAYSNNIPHLATGTVVPPRAGNFLAMLGDNNKDYEVVSPLGTIRQAVDEALDARGGIGNERPINIIMEVDGNKFAQLVYKHNNQETQRVGVRMVTGG